MSLAIDVQNVSRVFESKGKEPFYALRDANLQVEPGELFGLLGPNGAGKSTLIKILSTLLLPTSGTARVAGFDVVHEADRVRRSINMVSGGEHSGYGILTVRESLWLFAQFHGIPSREAPAASTRRWKSWGWPSTPTPASTNCPPACGRR